MKNLLATRFGRLLTFFLLYVTEGIPQGFAAVAVAFQMRKQGVAPEEVGAFVATLYLPWAYKVVAGPVVDLIYSDRLGKRRAWIVGCQIMMAATLLAAWPVDFSAQLWLFSAIIVIHNIFAATQDVAIDALAVSVLPEEERGVANGFMFAGAYSGNAVGGAGVLYLTQVMDFTNTFWLVAGAILLITVFISLRIRESRSTPPNRPPETPTPPPIEPAPDFGQIGVVPYASVAEPAEEVEIRLTLAGILQYIWTLLKSMFGSVPAVAAFFFALLPCGAFGISMTASRNLAAEFGIADSTVANIMLASTALSAFGCIAGGFISDRIGRRKAIAIFVLLTLIPTIGLAWHLQGSGWIMPVDMKAADRPAVSSWLVTGYIIWSMIYAVFMGFIYGSRTASFMDISNPGVAATQFTAYMSLMNLALAFTSFWQGYAVKWYGYPKMLLADCAFGLLCLIPLAFMAPRRKADDAQVVQQPEPATGNPS